jgi:hypothetical protein
MQNPKENGKSVQRGADGWVGIWVVGRLGYLLYGVLLNQQIKLPVVSDAATQQTPSLLM